MNKINAFLKSQEAIFGPSSLWTPMKFQRLGIRNGTTGAFQAIWWRETLTSTQMPSRMIRHHLLLLTWLLGTWDNTSLVKDPSLPRQPMHLRFHWTNSFGDYLWVIFESKSACNQTHALWTPQGINLNRNLKDFCYDADMSWERLQHMFDSCHPMTQNTNLGYLRLLPPVTLNMHRFCSCLDWTNLKRMLFTVK